MLVGCGANFSSEDEEILVFVTDESQQDNSLKLKIQNTELTIKKVAAIAATFFVEHIGVEPMTS